MRVVPRDLFNESKLLKCLGRISVDILDGHAQLHKYGIYDILNEPEEGFDIYQNDDGDISCTNYVVSVPTSSGAVADLYLYTRLNSKANWPLHYVSHEGEPIEVFTNNGAYTTEFLHSLNELMWFVGDL